MTKQTKNTEKTKMHSIKEMVVRGCHRAFRWNIGSKLMW